MKFLLPLFFVCSSLLFSQDTLLPVIFLKDVDILENKNELSVDDFMNYVQKDTTFYKGFKHLRYYKHKYESNLKIFNKKNTLIGSIYKKGIHYSNKEYAWIKNDSVRLFGKLFKRNGKHRFYTAKAFDDVFFPNDSIKISLNITKRKDRSDNQNLNDAKTVGFSVGSDKTEQNKGGVRKKLAIFSQKMQPYYDYLISDTIYKGVECYVFMVVMREDIKNENKVIIKKLVSFFDKNNFTVLYRHYKFDYKNLILDVDMDVKVYLNYVNDVHVPTEIYYKGNWNVMFFKPERSEFILKNTDFVIE